MARVFRSLSGDPMGMTDDDRILCIMMQVPWEATSNLKGTKIVGLTAMAIRDALREEGFEIRRR